MDEVKHNSSVKALLAALRAIQKEARKPKPDPDLIYSITVDAISGLK